jgi:ABC-type multidrug transport system ATPase subunit
MPNICFFCSTLFSSTRTAQTAGYAIVLVGFVFQSILSSAEGRLADMLWAPDVPDWVVVIKWVLTFYPPFNFSKAFSDFARRSSATLDVAAGLVKEGSGMHWDDLYRNETMNFPAFRVYVNIPAPIEAMSWMIMNAGFFILLAWYCDNVVSGDHGSPRPFYFLFTPEYWGCGRKKRSSSAADDSARLGVGEDGYDSDVAREAASTEAGNNTSEVPAVRLVRLMKEYRKYALCRAKTDTKAVNDLSLTIQQNEIFCLLGHNGAGKTTLINILTGLFPASSGDAEIAGLDIVDHMDEIREQLGVCPQHDILWPELTAREHLQLFAQLKGIPSFLIDREVHEKIVQVGLEEAADNPAGSFSGGMKRRLSVAISTIGNPKVVFMDEPTTGLDPVNKRAVWHLIQSMKKDRCIILTTHSMEEADVLSDRIAIMAYGKIRCIGNGLHLKSKYGSGYRISMLTEQAFTQTVISAIEEKFSGLATLAANDAGAIAFNVSQKRLDQVPELIAFIDKLRAKTADGHEMIHEWGVSHSTLEEVFLAITKRHHFVYDDIDPDLDDSDDGATVVSDMPTAISGAPSADHSQPSSDNGHKFAEKPAESDDEEEQDTKPLLASSSSVNSKTENRMPAQQVKRPKQSHPPSHPYRALFRKNLSLQARQKFTNVCQIITPVLVIIILVILRKIIQVKVGDTTITEFVPTVPFPLNAQGYQMPSINSGTPSLVKASHSPPMWKAVADSIDFDDLYLKAEDLLRSGAKICSYLSTTSLLGVGSPFDLQIDRMLLLEIPYP